MPRINTVPKSRKHTRVQTEQDEAWEQALQEMREEAEGVLDSFNL